LLTIAAAQCQSPVVTKSLTGSVAGVPSDQGYGVIMGTTRAFAPPAGSPNFTLENIPDAPRDLIGASLGFMILSDDYVITPKRFIVRRALNPPAGAVLPVLDFGSSEAFDAATATVTLSGTNGANVETNSILSTASGTMSSISVDERTPATTRTWYGLPASRLIAGDLQALLADDDRGRQVISYGREVAPTTVAFGPETPPPQVSVYSMTPMLRMRAVVNLGQPPAQYNGMIEATFMQPGINRAFLMHFSRATLEATQVYELRTPALDGLAGWNESVFGLQPGSKLEWTLEAFSEWNFIPTAGAVLRSFRSGGEIIP
jgi:hypothetical protein